MIFKRLIYCTIILVLCLPLNTLISINTINTSQGFSKVNQTTYNPIDRIAVSPDGSLIAIGFNDYTVHILNASNFALIKTLGTSITFSSAQYNPVVFSPNGSIFASATQFNILLWNTTTWQNFRNLTISNIDVRDIAFSPDGSLIAGFSISSYVWNVNNNFTLIGTKSSCYSWVGGFTPDSKRIISKNSNGPDAVNANIWNSSTLATINSYTQNTVSITTLAVSKKSNLVVDGSGDGTIRAWNPVNLSTYLVLKNQFNSSLTTVAISPDDNYIAYQGFTNIVVYSLSTNSSVGNITNIPGGLNSVTTLYFHPLEDTLFVALYNGSFEEYAIPSLQLIKSYPKDIVTSTPPSGSSQTQSSSSETATSGLINSTNSSATTHNLSIGFLTILLIFPILGLVTVFRRKIKNR